ncbi:MAG: pseudouridine synthase [Proteobacteria bacterium]|nr:pseudouridine synthase [Pseudomonadota bacterium]
MSTQRIDKLLGSLGYIESRKLAARLLRNHEVLHNGVRVTDTAAKVTHAGLTLDGKPLDPPQGMVILLNKPLGYVSSHADSGLRIYDLLPPRFMRRSPVVTSIGRLDKDATGLLLLTDDGKLVQRLTSPRRHVPKTYAVELADALKGHEAELFAAGTLMLRGEDKPLLPAVLEVTGEKTALLTLHEGRYHQVKRMFAAAGNRVEALHRTRMGALELGSLQPGEWRILDDNEKQQLLKD